MLLKQKSPLLPGILAVKTFGELLLVFIPPLFRDPEMLSSVSDKAKLFTQKFSKNSNLDDLVFPLLIFPCKTKLKQHNVSVSAKMV